VKQQTKADQKFLQEFEDNFSTLREANGAGDLVLMACRSRRKPDQRVPVICAVNAVDGRYEFVPLARMFLDDPNQEIVVPKEEDQERASA